MKWKKQRRERILYKWATERAAERTFLSPTFAAIQLKRLRKSAVLARASRSSRKVSLLCELVKRRRREERGRDALRRSLHHSSSLFSSLSSYVYLVNGNCLSANRWAEHSNPTPEGLLQRMPSYAFNIAIPFQPVFQCFCFVDPRKTFRLARFLLFFMYLRESEI